MPAPVSWVLKPAEPQHQFVREKIQSTTQAVTQTYETVKNSNSLVSWAFSKVENVASYAAPLVTPVTNAVVNNIADPLLNKVDGVVGAVHDKVFPGQAAPTAAAAANANLSIPELAAREKIKLAVDAEWFRHVDEIIARGFDIKHSFTVFYHAGVESYRAVYDATTDGVVSYDAFIARFEKTLHKTWETRLALAAKTFYNKAEANFNNYQPKKGSFKKIPHALLFQGVKEELLQHELHVVQAFREQLGHPSAYVYNTSVEVFLQLGPTVSPNAFVNGVKGKLGTSWSDSLELPIAEFYEGAKKVPTDDLIKFTKTIGMRGWTFGDVINVFSACRELTSEEVTSKYQALLQTSQSIIDYVIPDKSGTDKKDLTITDVVTSVPTRVADRVYTGVKQSSEAVAPLIHVDLVQFSENVISSTKNKAKETSAELSAALAKLRAAMDDMKNVAISAATENPVTQLATDAVTGVTEAVTAPIKRNITEPIAQTVTPYAHELKDRLHNVAETANELKEHSADYITNAEIRQFPSDTMSFLSQATNLVIPASQNAEFSESVVKVQQVLSALKDVFIWSGNWKEHATTPAPVAAAAPAK